LSITPPLIDLADVFLHGISLPMGQPLYPLPHEKLREPRI
jgi:hypothetical protein